MVADGNHLWREDTRGAIESWKRLIELRHVSTDRGFAFDHVHRRAAVREFECGLNARDATTDDERRRMNGHAQRFEWFVIRHTLYRARNDRFRFLVCCRLVGVHPGNMLANRNKFAQVRV